MVVTFIFAFLAVLALIALAAWLVRRFASNRLGANTNRGRMPRLAVIDAAAVDGRRRLVLVRRDNIEHLLMIGGPSDIVVESNIVRASPAREQLPQRPGISQGAAAPEPPRIVPLPDTAWNESEAARGDSFALPEPPLMPEPPPRQNRPSFADELRRPIPQPAERRSEPLTGFAPEPLAGGRPERTEPRSEPRPEPRPEPKPEPRAEPRPEPVLPRLPSRGEPMLQPRPVRPAAEAPKPLPQRPSERAASPPPPPPPPAGPPAPTATPAQNADQNLAEMAQRLEAALRRPANSAPAEAAPSVAPEPPPIRERAAAPRSEPPAAAPSPAPAASPKSNFENLEDEMASLLGRPKSSSS